MSATGAMNDDARRAEGLARATERLARGSKSFAFAGKLLPRQVREDAAVLYAWCRRTDDAIDEAEPGCAGVALGEVRAALASVFDGAPQGDPEMHAFQEVVRRRRIPRAACEDLVAGMEMDATGQTYRTGQELELYCYRVAGTVGLMMAQVMGVEDDRYLPHAVALGKAMQLTNIARDVEEDWRRGRRYIPAAWLPDEAARLVPGGAFPVSAREAFAPAVARLLSEAERFYRMGDEGLKGLSPRCAIAVGAARRIYAAIGTRVAAQGHDVTAGRAVVPGWRKLGLALGAAWHELAQGRRSRKRRLLAIEQGEAIR